MDAEALIGKQAGSSTLHRVVGNGTLGAVYLGQQLEPARQVAVKVFLRLASLEPQQQRAFLAAFREEMTHVFALDHPHILPIYDYGAMDGLPYITMPWIVGETLEDIIAHEGALPLGLVANCLQQIAAALDYAHSQGVVHRDLKPANIFLTPEQKMWVADFHLTAMLSEGNTGHMRLSRPGLLDYMSPELIVGKRIDHRADLYSLGVLLYRMVTGVPLFQGQTLMKVATKHLKMPPPSPRATRPDLPPAAEQVILKALAKDPAERFDNAGDMALLFQQAINQTTSSHITSRPAAPRSLVGTRLIASASITPGPLATSPMAPGPAALDNAASGPMAFGPIVFDKTTSGPIASDSTLSGGNSAFDLLIPGKVAPGNSVSAPIVSENKTPYNSSSGPVASNNPAFNPARSDNSGRVDAALSNPIPASAEAPDTGARPFVSPPFFGPSWRTSALPAITPGQSNDSGGVVNLPRADASVGLASSSSSSASLPSLVSFDPFAMQNGQPPLRTASQKLPSPQGATQANPLTPTNQTPGQETLVPIPGQLTWGLPQINQDENSTTGTYKLTGPARIVSIPVAGQPGRYMTGILPTAGQPAGTAALPAPAAPVRRSLLWRKRLPILVLVALLIVGGSLGFAYIHFASPKHSGGSTNAPTGTPNFSATASAQADATANANIILSDPLSQNIRGWPENASGSFFYQFKGGAYHITNNDSTRVAIAILPGENLSQPFVYTLTMDEIRGNDSSANNESGMILRFNSQTKNGKQIISFYSFEVVNEKGGQYQFWKYDNSQGPSVSPWKQLASRPFGSEFHQGQGSGASNTFKILVNGKNFIFIVNGKQVWSVQDSTLTGGQVGMLVNLKGTEVAFSNLLLTWH